MQRSMTIVTGAVGMLAAAFLGAAPASASVFDYGLYAAGQARLTGGSYGRVASGSLVNEANAAAVTSVVASTAALTDQAKRFSADLAGRAQTGLVASVGGLTTLTGLSAGVNVFNLTGSQFAGIQTLTLAQLGAGAVINVSGPVVASSIRLGVNASVVQNLLFNFGDATSVVFAGADLGASVLAPHALVRLNGGAAAGAVIADSFEGVGAAIGGRGFLAIDIDRVAPVAASVPEPAAWGTMILGLGLAGAVLRRPRRTPAARAVAA